MTKETAYFCPDCGSPSVNHSVLIGGTASCNACGWKGSAEQLTAYSFEHDLGDAEQVLQLFARDMRKFVAQNARPLADILRKWGFLKEPIQREDFMKQLTAMTVALTKSAIEYRAAQEQQKPKEPARVN